ncbi:glycosyltransferase family 4 protein [Streptoalloteichus tenebrarius]|uniref:glycosyltransferase family 4 protein n=1 Tax=Streptoalloteichus tenebrarius (strain ATCC 17920 / DSM 40477 / JCM 4838 / CBS 697.72 / NBRC 16177 / NCIMB 11028 / NRRL B-12390 / A12253. 1 / ISP 5477) TaxID=1933 RepID=UPI0020A371B8|nr:glycosyltransferase family 4 protein [Streptoalloteichus tenebrarius]
MGGIEVQVGELARAQRASGAEIHVITATPEGDAGLPDPGYPVHRVTAALPWELPVHPRAGQHILRLLRRLGPDVVHVHVGAVSPFAWSAVRCAVRAGLPTVVTVHSMWDPVTRGIYRTFDQLTRWSDFPLVASTVSSAAAGLVRRVAPELEVAVVPNGIDPSQWRVTPASDAPAPNDADDADNADDADRSEDGVHVVAVGRLAPRKQPITLLDVLRVARSRLRPEVPLRATIAGSGPALEAMRRHLRRHGMADWVRLAGRLDRAGIHELLRTADVFVSPTVRESFGIAALEARTAGVPVVARAGTGVADFVRHGREGLLCHSAGGLGNAVAQLAGDHQLRRRIAAHNLATEPTHCTWPAVTSAFQRLYERAAALSSRHASLARPLPS